MGASIRAGDVLAGRYRMVDLLGEAEGGWFWCAHDEVLHRPVAVHLLGSTDERAAVLMDAARRAAVLDDRRNLRVLDADTTDRVSFVVNEWGHGDSLDLVLEEEPMPPAQAAWVVAEVADTIARAHAAGVSHDHLVPEHVLLDETGEVRIIGLAVDAALHGVPSHQPEQDVTHLASLLYACLTCRWPGPGRSLLPDAPTAHDGTVLRPRQVRAGIPRALDRICDEMLLGGQHSRSLGLGGMLGHRDEHDLTTAEGVRDALLEFLGDPGAQVTPDPVPVTGRRGAVPVMPPVPEPAPEEGRDVAPTLATPPVEPVSDAASTAVPEPVEPAAPADPVEIPTEAGMPVFHGDDDVEWMRARARTPAPPPAFEQPEERPLFASDPEDGSPVVRPRPTVPAPPRPPRNGDEYWPWDTQHPSSVSGSGLLSPVDEQPVPGRTWMRLAWIVGAAALVLLAVVAAYQIGLGTNDDEPPADDETPAATPTGEPTTAVAATATDFDPEGDPPEEYPEDAPLAVDGDPATAWGTQTYEQQFGPGGLKSGVGLVLDLGGSQDVRRVRITVRGGDTAAQVYVTDGAPTDLSGLEPAGAGTGNDVITVDLDDVSGSHVVVWLTRVPQGADGFRGEVAEVEVLR